MILLDMMRGLRELLIIFFFALLSKATATSSSSKLPPEHDHRILRRQRQTHHHDQPPPAVADHSGAPTDAPNPAVDTYSYNNCLSWRLAVETNNMCGWRTVPASCFHYVETYMVGGQYDHDLNFIVDTIIINYIDAIPISNDGLDAWVLDVDDTLISNLFYYKGKRFGCDPYDPQAFKIWASKRGCPSIPAAQRLFKKLLQRGLKVFIVTGRDEETLGQATLDNLEFQGFSSYERLILRTEEYKGRSAAVYKSEIRKKLAGEGYRIWGNVGDQWSDLQGEFGGNRTFKLPNPMYFVP